jgi:hypothetical protein
VHKHQYIFISCAEGASGHLSRGKGHTNCRRTLITIATICIPKNAPTRMAHKGTVSTSFVKGVAGSLKVDAIQGTEKVVALLDILKKSRNGCSEETCDGGGEVQAWKSKTLVVRSGTNGNLTTRSRAHFGA